ncbi:hypothetical protein [Oceanimonas baumannii]|uniref:Uncharacterized protein n=2 Tax=Oceanimonas baumannii TaxID=129578 RepID=A0A235CJA5_9GAMM|nr:hypothetical protein [Oceanimonas baumannii]OYD24620.1 hypothetical protein B6S09_08275 [Oceanimonas baumannii]TDW59358.1 hypothetical protein LY04_01602 [Oceanimonas baumannii]
MYPPPDPHMLLWDEYKYRHDHIWQKLFQITIAVVLLGAVPYLKPEITQVLKGWILIAPLLGTVLSLISLVLMHFELTLFGKIARAHRSHQEEQGLVQHSRHHYFRYLVMTYVSFLLLVSIANIAVVRLLWLTS